MNNLRIIQLAQKIVEGSISEAELEEFNNWYYSDDGENYKVNSHDSSNELAMDMFRQVSERIGVQVKQRRLWPRIAVAAAVAVVIFGAGLFYFTHKQDNTGNAIYANDVKPGRNGATLTLANGKKIYIADNKAGKLADESGVSISKTADGQIIYTIVDKDGQSGNAINTLQTSNGEQAQIRLPDGTVVYLNSASSLKYPASFAKLAKRTVELSGEGYFQVSKDKAHPFIVKTEYQEVEVLGTQFNINSYADEPATSTTLLEGSVKVTGENKVTKILKPNQQAVNSATGITVIDVEAQFSIDWKEGFFMFNNEDLESIMKRVARWYNVKVIYSHPALKTKTFVGTISKYENISRVIQVLEGTGLASFKLNQNVLTISKKNKAD